MKQKPSKRQTDHYTREAFKRGYPARSIFKLEEINKKAQIDFTAKRILDVGAAPGSWTLYAAELTGPRGDVFSIDLKPLRDTEKHPQWAELSQRIHFVQGDATKIETVKELLNLQPVDVLISDAAPATTGNRLVDTSASAGLFETILWLCAPYLKPGGAFVGKLFQGGDEVQLRKTMAEHFAKVIPFKPQACRDDSFEMFLIGIGYKGTMELWNEDYE